MEPEEVAKEAYQDAAFSVGEVFQTTKEAVTNTWNNLGNDTLSRVMNSAALVAMLFVAERAYDKHTNTTPASQQQISTAGQTPKHIQLAAPLLK